MVIMRINFGAMKTAWQYREAVGVLFDESAELAELMSKVANTIALFSSDEADAPDPSCRTCKAR